MSTVDALVILAAFLMLAWVVEFSRAERLAEENRRLRADLQALTDAEWERLCDEAGYGVFRAEAGHVMFPARWADGDDAA